MSETTPIPCKHPTNCKGPVCPWCGYNRGDCQLQMDHHLCEGEQPAPCDECAGYKS